MIDIRESAQVLDGVFLHQRLAEVPDIVLDESRQAMLVGDLQAACKALAHGIAVIGRLVGDIGHLPVVQEVLKGVIAGVEDDAGEIVGGDLAHHRLPYLIGVVQDGSVARGREAKLVLIVASPEFQGAAIACHEDAPVMRDNDYAGMLPNGCPEGESKDGSVRCRVMMQVWVESWTAEGSDYEDNNWLGNGGISSPGFHGGNSRSAIRIRR